MLLAKLENRTVYWVKRVMAGYFEFAVTVRNLSGNAYEI